MCLIIASPEGKLIEDAVVDRGYHDNPHGWGIMRSDGTRIRASRGMDFKGFRASYETLNGEPYVIHFRWATHGTTGLDNCHPFKINKKLYVAHNGVLSDSVAPQIRKDMSDTWHYAQKLRNLGLHVNNLEATIPEIEKEIGAHNKLAFMTSSGEIKIANRHQGVEHSGVWLSNDNSLDKEYDWRKWMHGSGSRYCYTSPKRLNVRPAQNSWEPEIGKEMYDACDGCGSYAWGEITDFYDYEWTRGLATPFLCEICQKDAQSVRDYKQIWDEIEAEENAPLNVIEGDPRFAPDPRQLEFDRLLCEMAKH